MQTPSAASNLSQALRIAARIGKVALASSAAAIATLILGIVISIATDTEEWFGQLYSVHYAYVWGGLSLLWAPAMWKGLK
jgi:hypothetical protein